MKMPLVVSLSFLLLSGCQQAYFNTMEKLGVHKREILVDRVEAARDTQVEAKEQFQTALERFRALTRFDGGDLEDMYDRLNAEYQKSETKAEEVSDRIDAVQDVAEALFDEWEEELGQYSNNSYRQIQAKELAQARLRYQELIASMERAEARIPPVLTAFRDQVLFLKHSLNAQAIASLKTELISVQTDISQLIAEMERSIAASNEFINSLDN